MALQPAPDQRIDRSATTPFLLRIFYREHSFHSPSEFVTVPPTAELTDASLQLYTWSDTTLSELTSLITTSIPDILPSPSVGTRIGYRLVFPDTRSVTGPGGAEGQGRWLSKQLGSVVVGEDVDDDGNDTGQGSRVNGNGHGGARTLLGEPYKTLADARFVIGDYISCAIIPPRDDGTVAPLPAAERSGGPGGRDRGPRRGGFGSENGYGRGGGGGYGSRSGRGGGYPPERGFGNPSSVPSGDWRRGERLPDGPAYGGGRGRGRYH
ncbi:hypothetical protein K461DRAFT_297742 [Myriangium duriaei CBS 260.36]|uniref:Sin3-associated polypeptide Sap18 n=1 Tax=Myriangium duriaei CBS 260.36 TaxID=1168546 RepID=A0A9P4IQQ3_9PEZI|nr:hypothetical protein K461DRAFT_297742 [Myriangium duriaei CBS 260.36]